MDAQEWEWARKKRLNDYKTHNFCVECGHTESDHKPKELDDKFGWYSGCQAEIGNGDGCFGSRTFSKCRCKEFVSPFPPALDADKNVIEQ